MYATNKKVINKMKKLILDYMDVKEVIRYIKEFPYELDYNIFQYGCLDCYDYDLYKRLKEFGVNTKPVTEYEKVLDFGCTYKHRENIRNLYKIVVRRAAKEIFSDFKYNTINAR